MKKLLMIAAIALIAMSCNKNQKAVKMLDGEWKATSVFVNVEGFSLDLIALGAKVDMSFDKCKLKDDEYCNVVITMTDEEGTNQDKAMYRVTTDGTVLEMKDSDGDIQKLEIVELTKKKAELKQKDGDATMVFKLEKK